MNFERVARHLARLARFVRRPLADQVLAVQAFVLLGASRWQIKSRGGLKAVQDKLGERMLETATEISAADLAAAERIGWAIRGVRPYTPWVSNCFPQAVTAQRLLRRHGVSATAYLGATSPSGAIGSDLGFAAHAWVRAGELIVVGGDVHLEHTPIVWFGQPPRTNE